MSKNELSFDEFRAVLNREKNLKKNNDKNEDSNSSYLDGNYTYTLSSHTITYSRTYLFRKSIISCCSSCKIC